MTAFNTLGAIIITGENRPVSLNPTDVPVLLDAVQLAADLSQAIATAEPDSDARRVAQERADAICDLLDRLNGCD